jgi:hypothetical protein
LCDVRHDRTDTYAGSPAYPLLSVVDPAVKPGEITGIIRFAPTETEVGAAGAYAFNPNGGHEYVWHCHIIDHEDNEMMRPFSVQPRTDVCDPHLLAGEGV